MKIEDPGKSFCWFEEIVKRLECTEAVNGATDMLQEVNPSDCIPGDTMSIDEQVTEENDGLVSHFDHVDPSLLERMHVCYIANHKGYFKKKRF
eukprot:768013-Hanusia_phi.AAC.15